MQYDVSDPCTTPPPEARSQIFGTAGESFAIPLNPQPLHPRPIEGNPIRLLPPVRLTPERLAVLMEWARPQYMRQGLMS